MKKISVIVPVYNVEKYVKRCIDSIIRQKYDNMEIIIVNDGTTDNSEEILRPYIEKYNYIKYYKKENGGLSDARNYGVRYATGDYICFIDSDDYISEDLFERLSNEFDKDVDLIKYKAITIDPDGEEIEKVDGPVFEQKTGIEAFNTLYGSDVLMVPAVLYFYKKSFWDSNNFSYPVGKYHEDFARTPLVILKAKSVISTDVYGYFYVQSSYSITRGNNEDKKLRRALDMIEHYDYMNDEIKSYKLDKKTEENVKIYYTNCIIIKLKELSNDSKKVLLDEIKKRKMISNIKVRNFKQLIKKVLLKINVNLYLKMK